MNYYCPKCFYKIEYKFNKPDKCTKCSFDFAASLQKSDTGAKHAVLTKNDSPEPLSAARVREREKIKKRIQMAENIEAKKDFNSQMDDFEENFEDDSDSNYEWRPGLSELKRNPGISIEVKENKSISLRAAVQGQTANVDVDFKELKSIPASLSKEQILEEFRRESSGPAKMINID